MVKFCWLLYQASTPSLGHITTSTMITCPSVIVVEVPNTLSLSLTADTVLFC